MQKKLHVLMATCNGGGQNSQ